MVPAARWLAASFAIVFLSACNEALYSGLSETDVNRMRQVLAAQGIEARKVQADGNRFTLEVPRELAARALLVLDSAGLPAPRYASALDSLRADALVPSAGEDRARLLHGLSQELAATIGSFEGVVQARVHLSIPDRSLPGQRAVSPPSASVFVRHRPGHNLAAMTLPIKLLVARSVEGLVPDRVSVVTVAIDPTSRIPTAEVMPAPVAGAAIGTLVAIASGSALAGAGIGAFAAIALWRRRQARVPTDGARRDDPDAQLSADLRP
jgi:type III secretion protein J